MIDALWFSLLIKVGVTAATVVAAAIAAEKSGPFWGGLVVGLPVSAGPAYVMLAIEYDTAFLEVSSLNSLAGNTGAVIFLLAFVYAAPRFGLAVCLALSTGLWVAVAFAIRAIEWTFLSAMIVNLTVIAIVLLLTRNVDPGPPTGRPLQKRWYDLPMRALAVGLFVAAVVSLGEVIGPESTGILSVYPVTLTSLALLAMPRLGGQTTAALMAGIVRSMVGFALGFVAIHLTVVSWGAPLSLSVGLAIMLAWAGVRMAHRSWTTRRN